jgi:hypothetical protein
MQLIPFQANSINPVEKHGSYNCAMSRLLCPGGYLLTLVPRSQIFLPWRWRQYVPPKRRFTQVLHGATFRKTAFFIVTAVKSSNLTYSDVCSAEENILMRSFWDAVMTQLHVDSLNLVLSHATLSGTVVSTCTIYFKVKILSALFVCFAWLPKYISIISLKRFNQFTFLI